MATTASQTSTAGRMSANVSYVPPYHPALMENLKTDAAQVHMLLGELRSLTEWPLELLCTHLGCSQQGKPVGISADDLMAHSVAYLTWVTALCNLVDRPEDRHDILQGAFDMTVGAGGDVQDRVARCRRACTTAIGGQTANDLVELGEVQKAWRLATAALENDPDSPPSLSTSLDDRTPHLHPRRLQWLFADGPTTPYDMLGPVVARRMHAHLRDCERCKAAADHLRPSPMAVE